MVKLFLADIGDVDINGRTKLWKMNTGAKFNEEYLCECIYKMINAEKLFSLLVKNEAIDVTDYQFRQYCKATEQI